MLMGAPQVNRCKNTFVRLLTKHLIAYHLRSFAEIDFCSNRSICQWTTIFVTSFPWINQSFICWFECMMMINQALDSVFSLSKGRYLFHTGKIIGQRIRFRKIIDNFANWNGIFDWMLFNWLSPMIIFTMPTG